MKISLAKTYAINPNWSCDIGVAMSAAVKLGVARKVS
jgi:hypothetical protein